MELTEMSIFDLTEISELGLAEMPDLELIFQQDQRSTSQSTRSQALQATLPKILYEKRALFEQSEVVNCNYLISETSLCILHKSGNYCIY